MKRFRLLMASIATSMFGLVLMPVVVHASTTSVDFESYTLGNIEGQDGWSSDGAAGSGCALYDHKVASSEGTTGFGSQSLRISNAVTSGCFGDQAFSKSLTDEAGETSAQGGGLSGGTRQPHFEAQFSLATTESTLQPGLSMSVSPDRGDGARMSYLRFVDQADGVHVFFDDYKDNAPFGNLVGDSAGCNAEDDFTEVDIATLTRGSAHTVKFAVDFVDGPRNDVVKIYLDGLLKATGTSWEDYFRYCEGNETRTVDSLLFRTAGTAAPATSGNGFLIDNLSLLSTLTDATAPTVDLIFPTPGPSSTGFQTLFSESVIESEAENPANYFLNNWPGAGGSGDLSGDATVVYDDSTKTATVTFINEGWYISAEQEWGVQNIHDLQNNLISPNPTTETSTIMVAPFAPGAPTTQNPTLSTSQTWTWTAAIDPGGNDASGVASYEYRIDGGTWTNIGNVLTVNTSFTNGTHTLGVRAIDNAGNTGIEASGSVTVFTDKEQCKNNGWSMLGSVFKNQGDCVSYFATKTKNQPSGGVIGAVVSLLKKVF
jgi:hypothetical protein